MNWCNHKRIKMRQESRLNVLNGNTDRQVTGAGRWFAESGELKVGNTIHGGVQGRHKHVYNQRRRQLPIMYVHHQLVLSFYYHIVVGCADCKNYLLDTGNRFSKRGRRFRILLRYQWQTRLNVFSVSAGATALTNSRTYIRARAHRDATPIEMKPSNGNALIAFFLSSLYARLVNAIELTFELQDNAKDCYYENIEKNTSTTLEYQVRARSLAAWTHVCASTFCVMHCGCTALFAGSHRRPVRRRRNNRDADQRSDLQASEVAVRQPHFHGFREWSIRYMF